MADNNNKNKKYKCTCFLCGNIPDFLLSTNEETAKYLLKQISYLLWCDYCVEDVQSHDPRIGLCRICKAKIDYSYNFVTLLRTKFPLYKENIKRISVSPPTSLIDQPVKVRRLELPEETETEDSYRPIEVKVEIDDYHMYDQAYVNECNSINTENENKNDKNSQETDTDCLQHIVKIENCESENEVVSDVVGTKAKNDEPTCRLSSTQLKTSEKRTSSAETTLEDHINHLRAKLTEKTTGQNTKWAAAMLKAWLTENSLGSSFEILDPSSLNNILERFYGSLHTQKGGKYSKSALIGIRSGLNRHLTSPPYSRDLNIMKDSEFMTSNQVLKGLIKSLKDDGNDLSKPKEPISDEDLKKLYECGIFDEKNPTTLQNKVLYEIIAQFGRRGKDSLHLLKKNSFCIKQDGKGRRFLSMTYSETNNAYHDNDSRESSKEPRMYESGGEFCPLKSFQLYLSKLSPKCDRLFQRPCRKFDFDSDVWYESSQMGQNKISCFMSRISSEAGLSQKYTNHCIRAFHPLIYIDKDFLMRI